MATKYIEQFIRCNSVLEERTINLSDLSAGENIISAIPNNAVVMSVDIDVIAAGVGTMDIGVKGDTNMFISNIDLTSVKNNISSVRFSTDKIVPIVVKVSQAQNLGQIIFRMHFFGNEVRMLDYTLQK